MVLAGLPCFAESDWELLEAIRRAESAQQAEVAARKLEAKLLDGGDRITTILAMHSALPGGEAGGVPVVRTSRTTIGSA